MSEPIGNSDELPVWLKSAIEQRIYQLQQADKPAISHKRIEELEWVLSLRRDQQ